MFWFKKKSKVEQTMKVAESPKVASKEVCFTTEVTKEEQEEVEAYLSKQYPGIKVHSISKIDQDKEAAVVIAASVLANDKPQSTFRLVSMKEDEGRNENA